MGLGHQMRRPPSFRLRIAIAAVAAAIGGAVAAEAGGLAPPGSPLRFSETPVNPLVETLDASRPAGSPSVDLGPFQRLQDSDAATASALAKSPPRIIVGTAASAPPDPLPTAIATAVARFIVRDDRVNPLGGGDWPAAKAAIGAFYADRGFRPVWVDADGLTSAGRAGTAQLARASDDGLAPTGLPLPHDLVGPLEPEALAAAEIAIAAGVVVYAEQASGSRLSPSRISPVLAAQPQVADPGEALAETAAASDPGQRLADFNPPQKGYRALREALKRVKEAAASGASRLDAARVGLGVSVSDAPAFNDDPLLGAAAKAGKASARRRVYVASAAAAHARSALERERAAILANMEMWRWEPRDMGERRIEVNIPDFSVAVMDGDAVVMSSRVVVGKPNTPTPVFSDWMRYVLINPAWQVPDSIVKKEILPRLDHFARLGYEVKTVGGRVVVRQPPGEDNALGRLAFMFPNDHSD